LFIVYAVCGLFVFFILRALGELVLHRPSSGSFVSYAREFHGEKAAYVAGWMYFFNWACTSIVDVTAVALYMHYWGAFAAVPQWTIALIALVIVLTVNMISVKLFGEMEFWAALIKVIALVTFLVVGIVFLAGRFTVEGQGTGFSVIADNGGILPTGVLQLVIVTSGVIFAYAAVELVGTAAGETENPAKIMPRAINSVIFRIAVFYVGSLILLALLLPYTAYKHQPVRHVLRLHRRTRRGRHHEFRGADRGAVEPQRGAVLHRPNSAVDVDERERAEVHLEDDQTRCAVCGYRADGVLHDSGRLLEPCGTG
jgi:L-asparagine permease